MCSPLDSYTTFGVARANGLDFVVIKTNLKAVRTEFLLVLLRKMNFFFELPDTDKKVTRNKKEKVYNGYPGGGGTVFIYQFGY